MCGVCVWCVCGVCVVMCGVCVWYACVVCMCVQVYMCRCVWCVCICKCTHVYVRDMCMCDWGRVTAKPTWQNKTGFVWQTSASLFKLLTSEPMITGI